MNWVNGHEIYRLCFLLTTRPATPCHYASFPELYRIDWMWDDSVGSWAWSQDSGVGRVDTRMDLPVSPLPKALRSQASFQGWVGPSSKRELLASFRPRHFYTLSVPSTLSIANIFAGQSRKDDGLVKASGMGWLDWVALKLRQGVVSAVTWYDPREASGKRNCCGYGCRWSTRREDCSSTLGSEEPGLALAVIPSESLPDTESDHQWL